MGGSDQWGNIINGIELARRMEGLELFGVPTPLLTTADGAKMGKTAAGAVWLNADALSPYDYRQFWRNTHDADVGRFLRLFTDLPMDEIARLETLQGAEINAAKDTLADAATAMAHGAEAARSAGETARRTFGEGGGGEALPSLAVPGGQIALVDALVGLGFAASKGEAKRLIRGGGARVAGEAIKDEAATVDVAGEPVRISSGKKFHGLLTSA
jgi:tyrosyl-tRNA synthetase